MNKNKSALFTLLFIASLLLTSCSGTPETAMPIEDSPQSSITEATDTPETDEMSTQEPAMTEVAIEETQATEDIATDVSTVDHTDIPGEPVYSQFLPGECNTGFNVDNGTFSVKAPCDNWAINLLERPVSPDEAEFYHYLDILTALAGQSEDWLFFRIDLFGAGFPNDDSPFTYYFELDTNQDGRGNYLIAVTNLDLYTTDWSVTGVQVYLDRNGDVGGRTAIRPDGSSNTDGYDTLIFEAGLGDDSDLAWVRHNPSHANQIEFALKKSLVGDQANLMWWAGAMLGAFDAQGFDLVDSTSEDTLYAIDTTCGWFLGQEMSYNIRKCYIAPEPTQGPSNPSQPAVDVCVQPPHPNPENNCWIWIEEDCEWVCFN